MKLKPTILTPHTLKTETACTSKTLAAYIYTTLRALIFKIRHSSYTVLRKFSREQTRLEGMCIEDRKILKWSLIKGWELRTVFNVVMKREQ
jgi:hypothetical protein